MGYKRTNQPDADAHVHCRSPGAAENRRARRTKDGRLQAAGAREWNCAIPVQVLELAVIRQWRGMG